MYIVVVLVWKCSLATVTTRVEWQDSLGGVGFNCYEIRPGNKRHANAKRLVIQSIPFLSLDPESGDSAFCVMSLTKSGNKSWTVCPLKSLDNQSLCASGSFPARHDRSVADLGIGWSLRTFKRLAQEPRYQNKYLSHDHRPEKVVTTTSTRGEFRRRINGRDLEFGERF